MFEQAEALPSELRAFLRRTVPEYMVPRIFLPMDRLPLTPNAKVDRNALPDPEGYDTRESIGRPLPGRRIVVITRDIDYTADGVQVAHSLDEALALAAGAGEDEAFVGGGAEIYRLALPRADRIYLTEVHESVDGDTLFPDWDRSTWELAGREDREPDARHAHPFSFMDYRRVAD